MKRLLILALAVVPVLAMAQDDLYFTSSKKAKEKAQKSAPSMKARVETYEPPVVVDYQSNRRSEDEYNRRYVYGGDYQNAGGMYADSLAASVDADGYVAEYDMDDPELDYRFSRRLVRFHNPRLYALASPYYWDLYYGYGAWDYLYDPYDPWIYHYGWRYGWTWGPWDCWYGGIWGWHSPYAWSYWGWGPGWHHPPMHGGGWHHGGVRNIVPREYNSSRGHMAAGNRLRTNAAGRSTLASRSNIAGGGADAARSRSTAIGSRSMTTEGRSAAMPNSRTRTSASQRSSANTRNNTQAPARSNSNQNVNSRSSSNSNRSSSNTNASSRSSSSYSGGSRSSGSGSFGGGSRSGGGFGGGSRGGGGRR